MNSLLNKFVRFLKPVRVSGKNNRVLLLTKISRHRNFIIRIAGNNNEIRIGEKCVLANTQVFVAGDNNCIIIEDEARFLGPCRIIMGGNSTLYIGKNVGVRGVEFNLNDANIEIGDLCMFSNNIILRNHDSHRIFDRYSRTQINVPKDIVLGRHVWIGQNVSILKGCIIGDDSVIGLGSIVTKGCAPGSVITGIPARVVKKGVDWDY